jgi:asparagine synthetase B (glutamine-hydrolysing)
MTEDKLFCMSSFLSFRYIEDETKDFFPGLHHENIHMENCERIIVRTADDIDEAIAAQFEQFQGKKLGLLLSGGMDSSILASYMSGCDAYTFRFMGGQFQADELARAESFAEYYNMNLHYVDISWETVLEHIDEAMVSKCAPVHSIEPQIMAAAAQAKNDGIDVMIIGDGSDYVFGGMDQLLSRDWEYEEFIDRYCYINPADVLVSPVSMNYLFDRYNTEDGFDFLSFMEVVDTQESYGSYDNAFKAAGLAYYDPYALLKMGDPLDLDRIRSGESKYLIRELFAKKYPDKKVPEKVPMPRPVDAYFADWEGPKREEFLPNLNVASFTGNQKWLVWCLERFLDLADARGWSTAGD